MATRVQAATLINTVKYQTDRSSLKKVRKDLKDLQTQFSKTMAAGTPGSARDTVRAARQTATRAVEAHVKAFEDVSKQRAKQAARNVQNNLNAMFGIDRVKKSARDSANVFKASFAAESDAVKRQNAEMERYNRSMLNQQEEVEKIRKKILAARAAAEARDRKANLISNRFSFEAGRLNLQAKEAENARRQMESLNKRYREGAIEVAEFRQQSQMLLRTLRDQSKEYLTLGDRLKSFRKGGSGGLGVGGMALGLGVAGGIGAAYLGASAARNALGSSIAQSRGLSRVGTMGISSEETQALQLAALRATGFDLSYEKISDIAKDTQDKVGQLSLGKWTQNKKTGEWSFGGGGELGDWVKIMTERGGYGREQAVNTLKSARGPVEFAIILENLRKQANLTDQEFTALSEAINDFSYITKSIGYDGQNVINAMQELARVGFLYTDQEKENLKELSNLAATYNAVSQVLQGKFSSAFVDGLSAAGITSKNLAEELAQTNPMVKGLGEFAGQTAGMLLKLTNAIPDWWDSVFGTRQVLNQSGNYYDDSAVGWAWNGIKSLLGVDTGANWTAQNGFNTQSVMNDRYGNMVSGNPYSSSAPLIQNNLGFTIRIEPNDEAFRDAFNVQALDVFNNGMEDMSFDINHSILGD